ncbi:MAG: hypothetical protein FJ265_16400, partial [Planctomycetes bacterium]|nr:hypothetical protein [Planctomycetota bacterium]
MMRLALALLGAVTTLSASTICQGRYPKAIEPEQAAVFALLDGFDARDNSERPFVKVLPEGRPESGWPPTPYDSGYGFLLEATARGFVVQMVNGNRLRFATTRPSAPRQRSTSFAPVDFRAFVHDWIARSRFGWEDRFEYFHRSPRTPLSPETTGLFLARACAHLGLDGELAKLWEALPPEFRSANALQGPNGLAASMLPADLNAK